MNEFKFEGYLTDEAINFFGEKLKREKRDGCDVVGTFITMADGKTHMPYKNEIFVKDKSGNISLK
jgi:hypothetical protein